MGRPIFELSASEIDNLEAPILGEEVKLATFELSPNKAADSNDLSAFFFQSQWDMVGESITQLMCKAFKDGCIPMQLNSTLLVLIPKKDNQETFA